MIEAQPGFVPATVLATEPMGNETLVTLGAEAVRVVARAGPDFVVATGATLFFRPVAERVHLFDTATGRRISNAH